MNHVWVGSTLLLLALRAGMALVWSVCGGLFGVLLGMSEALAVVLAVWNWQSARAFDLGRRGLVVPVCYLASMAFVPTSAGSAAGFEVAALLVLLLTIWVRLCLGISYTVGPSSWVGCVDSGPYGVIRHPLLALSVLSRLVALAAWPCWWNLAAFIVLLGLVLEVIDVEEAFLRRFDTWRAYAERVRWRLMPGVW